MPKIFGFSRSRTKTGRLKESDPSQGPYDSARPTKNSSQINEDAVVRASASGRSEDHYCGCSLAGSGISKCGVGCSENWTVIPTTGDTPAPRFQHAAAVVGSKMVVFGGDSGNGLLDDTMILSLDTLSWATASKIYISPTGLKIPAFKDHCLVSWGKSILLVGGKTDPSSDRVNVWSFNADAESWSPVEVKGDIPAARSGHTVIRAGPILIIFGGQDIKGRKLNDLHMFDLKSSTWLPLHYTGAGPSPRSHHVAALYDDRCLIVFGGQSKSKILNDLYSLDFETMIWSKVKIKGYHPSPRAGSCGVLCGNQWYIVGGGSKKKRYAETLVFDVSKLEWSVSVASSNDSIATSKGFSLISVHHKDKLFLVAFGGNRKDLSNQTEILVMVKNEHSMSWRSAPASDFLPCEDSLGNPRDLASHLGGDNALSRTAKKIGAFSGRKSMSNSSIDPTAISLRRQFNDEERNPKLRGTHEENKCKAANSALDHFDLSSQVFDIMPKPHETTVAVDQAGFLACSGEKGSIFDRDGSHPSSSNRIAHIEGGDGACPIISPTNIHQSYETKIATLTRKIVQLDGQISSALSNQETAEKNTSLVMKGRQEIERKLDEALMEVDLLKEKLANLELVHEEANNVSNMVHSDNVRLEHDVAFLKAVLDDTQKEVHSTRAVLSGERARSFQLQVEVFHLKQRLHSFESKATTPRKPFH